MRIALDIDSTLHDYWRQFSAAAERRFGIHLAYEHQLTWGITRLRPEQVKACVAETHCAEHVLAAEPYPGAVEVVRRWHEAGHFIHVTSHRSTDAHDATAQWLERIGMPYDELYCSYDKISRCVEIGIDLLVDDSPVNLVRAQEAGIIPATIVHPWNRELVEDEDIIGAEDWPALERALAPVIEAGRRAA
jgi:uncharacterized HAD superfamily protein